MVWVVCVRLFLLCLFISDPGETRTEVGNGSPGQVCTMGGGVVGSCQEVEACLNDGGVVEREGVVQLCAQQNSKIYVCCRKPQRIAKELCDAWTQYWRRDGKCVKETQLIVGGVNAKVGEFPHIAILGSQRRNRNITWFCGGSLISPHYVLTAAHCVEEEGDQYWVTLGQHDRNFKIPQELPRVRGPLPSSLLHSAELAKDTTETALTKQEIRVEQVIIHPKYASHLIKYYDIALLKLSIPAALTRRVLPACLPSDTSDNLGGKELIVAGWGWTSFGFAELTQILQKVNVPVVDHLECQAKWFNSTSPPRGILQDQLCAGAPGRDTCRGDSGGPLVDQIKKGGVECEHTVVGVVSFGRGCGQLGVYTRVASFLDWITGYIAPHGASM